MEIGRPQGSPYFYYRVFPDLFDRENVLRVLNYALGAIRDRAHRWYRAWEPIR